MKIKLDKHAFLPERAHPNDAGLDLRSPAKFLIGPHSYCSVPTGVHVELPEGTAGLVKSRSGLMVRHGIVTDGLIDEGYRGEIVVWLCNTGGLAYLVERGDKIAQLVVVPVRCEPIEITAELDMDTDRGTDGFGSTGR